VGTDNKIIGIKMSNKKVNIYQIYHQPELVTKLDPAFIPYDHCEFTKNNPEISLKLREWPIMRNLGLAKAKEDKADVWGFVSYAFNEKTNTPGQNFIDFIKNNPDNDVWFMEPKYYPINPFMNPWIQGDMFHPGISDIANSFLQINRKPVNVRKIPMPICWYNYFAGTEVFWQKYFQMIDNLILLSEREPQLYKKLFQEGPVHRGETTTPYFIFVIERLFPTLLAISELKYLGYKYRHNDFNVTTASVVESLDQIYKH
jgi:hypothetical protein